MAGLKQFNNEPFEHFTMWISSPVAQLEMTKFSIQSHHGLKADDVCDPVYGVSYAVVDTRLLSVRTRVAGGDNSCQVPSSRSLQHQGTSTVSLTRVFSTASISSAYHFRVYDDIDTWKHCKIELRHSKKGTER